MRSPRQQPKMDPDALLAFQALGCVMQDTRVHQALEGDDISRTSLMQALLDRGHLGRLGFRAAAYLPLVAQARSLGVDHRIHFVGYRSNTVDFLRAIRSYAARGRRFGE